MFPGCPRGCHCLSPADIMADKQGVTLSLEEEEDADVALAYKTPEKKSLQEIQELDPGDESLQKYKQALLGAIPAVVGKAGDCPSGWASTPAPWHCSTLAHWPGDATSAGAGSSGIPSTVKHPQQGGHILVGILRGCCPCLPSVWRPWHPPERVMAAWGPRLPWLWDRRCSFHRNGYQGPGNSLG